MHHMQMHHRRSLKLGVKSNLNLTNLFLNNGYALCNILNALSNILIYLFLGVSTKRKFKASKQIRIQNVDSVLLRAVNNPVFVPKTYRERVKFNPAATSSVHLASATKTTELLGKGFFRHEETPQERLQEIEKFVNIKIKQLTEDPGLLNELSAFMADYLSVCIRAEIDMIKLSDILLEKVGNLQTINVGGFCVLSSSPASP